MDGEKTNAASSRIIGIDIDIDHRFARREFMVISSVAFVCVRCVVLCCVVMSFLSWKKEGDRKGDRKGLEGNIDRKGLDWKIDRKGLESIQEMCLVAAPSLSNRAESIESRVLCIKRSECLSENSPEIGGCCS